MQTRMSYGSQAFGYWRGGAGLSGLPTAGKAEQGVATQGVGMASQGTVNVAGTAWEPSVLYLIGLVIVEMFVFGFLGRVLK